MSVYSLSLHLVDLVDGWDADATAIGEDMHMLLKCFFSTNGRLMTRSVFSAASHCSISSSSGRKIYGVFDLDTVYARYKQGLRHLWGSLDSGYALRQTFRARRIHNLKHIAILHMLWQAHFMLPHFVIMLIVPQIIIALFPSIAVHPSITAAIELTATMRLISFCLFNVAFTINEFYYRVATAARAQDMAAANLTSCVVETRRWWHIRHLAERAVFPIVGLLYGIMPSFVAQTSHLWTDQMVYVPSIKPQVKGLHLRAQDLVR